MQIGKLTPLPHRIAYSIIPCCIYVCVPISVWHADFCLCFPQTFCPIACWNGAEQRSSVFAPYHTMHHDSPPLACPVLFRSAPTTFPFPDSVPVSLPSPFSLCCCILAICSSLCGQGVTDTWERQEEGGRNIEFFFAQILLDYLLRLFTVLMLSITVASGKRWLSMDSVLEVGTFDRCARL